MLQFHVGSNNEFVIERESREQGGLASTAPAEDFLEVSVEGWRSDGRVERGAGSALADDDAGGQLNIACGCESRGVQPTGFPPQFHSEVV